MRVLIALHHPITPDGGAPGGTLSLGNALKSAGCFVSYYGFEHAFPNDQNYDVRHTMRYPWRLASHLAHFAHDFDVIDVSTGDNWPWVLQHRPGASQRHALITRNHGLEHNFDRERRETARQTGKSLGWKYPFYHGGFRLWEVKRSLQVADHCFLLNHEDAQFAQNSLNVRSDRITVLPYGLDARFNQLTEAEPPATRTLRLAFVGSWIERKGTDTLVEAISALHETGLDFIFTAFGTGHSLDTVMSEFPPAVRSHVRVIPKYANSDLPKLLADQEILLFPSRAEGFSRGLMEAMACGLVPVATPVGGALDIVEHDFNGMIVPVNDTVALAEAVRHLAADPEATLSMRRRAQETACSYRWDTIASKTISVYEETIQRRNGPR